MTADSQLRIKDIGGYYGNSPQCQRVREQESKRVREREREIIYTGRELLKNCGRDDDFSQLMTSGGDGNGEGSQRALFKGLATVH